MAQTGRMLRGAVGTPLVLTLFFSLASCANLLSGNLFEGFDGPPDAGALIGRYTEADGSVTPGREAAFVTEVAEAAESPRFYSGLSASDRTALNTALSSVYTNTALPVGTQQTAALLAAEVNLQGTAAGETANNLGNYILDGGEDPFSDPATLLQAVIPESAQGDAAAIAAILENLAAAGAAYNAFGGTLDGNDPPTETNMGAVAQNAAVAIVVAALVADGAGNGGAAGLAAILVAGDPISDDANALDSINNEGTALNNILVAAGFGGLFDGNGN
jgi:hypothetical protein